jgi:glycosyltransferase involved in cell wall biosynthesis
MPKVSVIVPNYNHARFLERRVRSVLEQTLQDFELICLDDSSTDNSRQVYEHFAGLPNARFIYNATNSGSPFVQWNRGVREARGQYVWIAEADDDADPRLLESLVRKLDENPQDGVAYCQSLGVDENNQITRNYRDWSADLDPTRWNADFVNDGRDESARYLVVKNTIPNASAAVFRKSAYESAGMAPEDMRLAGDWMLWSNLIRRSGVAFVAEPLNRFREHSSSMRNKTSFSPVKVEESYRVVVQIMQNVHVPRPIAEAVRHDLLRLWINTDLWSKDGVTWDRHRAIYALATKTDPSLWMRMATQLPAYLWDKARLSTAGRAVVHQLKGQGTTDSVRTALVPSPGTPGEG